MHHITCIICNSNELKPLKGYEVHDLIQCNSCSQVFMRQIPSMEELMDHYAKYPYDKDQYLSPLTIEAYQSLMKEFQTFRKTGNIMDSGCGQGWLLDAAIEAGWNAYGTEFSSVAVAKCRARGIHMHQGLLDPDMYTPESFDVVILSEVIEHINNPLEELNKIYHLLRPGGLIYITTPNFNCYLRYMLKAKYNVIGYPEHLTYYTKQTLDLVLKKSGFSKKKLLTTGISISRFEASNDKDPVMDHTSNDEKLRSLMSSSTVMRYVKNSVNRLLTYTGTGMTLKAYYVKK